VTKLKKEKRKRKLISGGEFQREAKQRSGLLHKGLRFELPPRRQRFLCFFHHLSRSGIEAQPAQAKNLVFHVSD
jgi:hypothetical protein